MKKHFLAVIAILLVFAWLMVNSGSTAYTDRLPAIITLLWWILPIISPISAISYRAKIKNTLSLITLLLSFIPLIYLLFLVFVGITFD